MANDFQQLPNPDNVPGQMTSGYQRQNNNILAIQTGLDTTEPYDNGAGLITIPAGGIIELNGVMFKLPEPVSLTKTDPAKAYWVAVFDNRNGKASASLVDRPGAWDSTKQGCYRTDGARTLNWVSLGAIEDNGTPVKVKENARTENLQLNAGWYYFQAYKRDCTILGAEGGKVIKNTFVKNIYFNRRTGNINISHHNDFSKSLLLDKNINRFISAEADGKLYFPSFLPGTPNIPAMNIYDIIGDTQSTQIVNATISGQDCLYHNDKLYVISSNGLEIYDISSGVVNLKPLSPNPVSMTIYDGKIYIVHSLNTVISIYNISSETITTKTIPNSGRNTSIIYDGKLYMPRSGLTETILDVYDIELDILSTRTIPGGNRYTIQVYNGKIYLPRIGFLDIHDIAANTNITINLSSSNNNKYTSQIYKDKLYIPVDLSGIIEIINLVNNSLEIVNFTSIQEYRSRTSAIFDGKLYLPELNTGNLVIYDMYEGNSFLECFSIKN